MVSTGMQTDYYFESPPPISSYASSVSVTTPNTVMTSTTSYGSTEENAYDGESENDLDRALANAADTGGLAKRRLPVELRTNAPSGSVRSYIETAKLNNKLLAYYNTMFTTMLSSNLKMQLKWKESMWLIHENDILFHLTLSNLFLHFYYKCIEQGTSTEDYLNLSGLKEYLDYSELHYAKFLELRVANPVLEASSVDFNVYVFATVNASYVLHHFLSPSKSITDREFWIHSRDVQEGLLKIWVTRKGKAELVKYYWEDSGSYSAIPQQIYKPLYLVGLEDFMPDEKSKQVVSDTVSLLIREFLKTATSNEDPLRVMISFLMRVDASFVDLIEKKHPVALIILCHYTMFMNAFDLKIIPRFCLFEEFKRLEAFLIMNHQNMLSWINLPKRVFDGFVV